MDMNKSENVEYKHNLYKEIIPDTERRKISERFEVLAQREDNWDGYDSKKPFKSLQKALARLANIRGWTLEPKTN